MTSPRRARRVARLVLIGLVAMAVLEELGKPRQQRTWQGRLLGVIPYDFRPPSWTRIREAYWNPADPRLFTDRVFGIGWALNLHRVEELLERGFRLLGGGRPTGIAVRRQG